MVPPEALVDSDQVKPAPLPPLAVKVADPRGAVVATPAMETPGPTATFSVAALPSESMTWTTSVTLAVAPAV